MSDQISNIVGYNPKNLKYTLINPKEFPVKKFPKRLRIQTLNPDGTTGSLNFVTPRVFSYGFSHNRDPNTGKEVQGFNLPCCLWNKNGPSEQEKLWTTNYENVCKAISTYVTANKNELGLFDLPGLTDKFNTLYWKRDDKGNQLAGVGPTLYVKIIERRDQKSGTSHILSIFKDPKGNPIQDPMTLLGQRCWVTALVKLESVYIPASNKCHLQVKLHEAWIELVEGGIRSLMPRPPAVENVSLATGFTLNADMNEHEEEKERQVPATTTNEIQNSDDENAEQPATPVRETPAPAPRGGGGSRGRGRTVRPARRTTTAE